MMKLIISELVKPMVRRVGTVVATLLVAKGIDAQLVDNLMVAASACALYGVDLLASHFDRRGR